MKKWIISLTVLLCLQFCVYAQPLSKYFAHAHNDYEHEKPFEGAYQAGFASIEVDVHLRNGQLLVGHDLNDLKDSRTLASLYLNKISTLQSNGSLRKIQLLIDIKTEAKSTLEAIVSQISAYPGLIQSGLVSFVISGNRPSADAYSSYPDHIQFDGRPWEKYLPEQLKKIALISDAYPSYLDRQTKMPDTVRIKSTITLAHQWGKPFRFWANQDTEAGWKFLVDLGVDCINTDQVVALSAFLKKQDPYGAQTLHADQPMMPYNRLVRSAGKVIRFGDPSVENHALDITSIPGTSLFAVQDRYGMLVMNLAGDILDRYAFSSESDEWRNAVSTYSGIKSFVLDGRIWIVWTAAKNKQGYLIWAEWTGKISKVEGKALTSANKSQSLIPNEVYIDKNPKESYVYVILNGTDEVVKLRWSDKQEIWRARTGVAPFGVVVANDKVYVTNWGGPQVTDSSRVTAGVPWGLAYTDKTTGATAEGSVSVYDAVSGRVLKQIKTGLHPNEIISSSDGKFLYVSNGNSDDVTVIATKNDQVSEQIPVGMYRANFKKEGSSPNGLVLDRENTRLFVSNGMDNAVAIVRLGKLSASHSKGSSFIEGFIPTEAYPSGSALINDTLVVANLESEGANVINANRKARGIHYQLGSVSIIPLPGAEVLKGYTALAFESAMFSKMDALSELPRADVLPVPVPERIGEPSVFKHVVYIIKENKTYDQVFGDMKEGRGDSSLCVFGERITPNIHALARTFGWMDNYYASGKSSAEGHQWSNAAIVSDYVEKNVRAWFRSYPHRQTDAMVYNKQGYIWNNAVTHGKTVRIYGEACTTVYDEKLKWLDLYRSYQSGTKPSWQNTSTIDNILPLISPMFPDNDNLVFSDQQRAAIFLTEWEQYEKDGNLPNLMILSLPNDHTAGTSPGFPTPNAMVADNDLALGKIIDRIMKSKYFDSTVIFITQDDSQGGWDHISAYRTVGIVISAYSTGSVIKSNYNQTSMVRTMEQILGLPPMNVIDATAQPMFDCFANTKKNFKFDYLNTNIPLDEMNKPLSALKGIEKKYAKQSMNEVYNEVDGGEDDEMNRIIWFYAKGRKKYPQSGF
ncbi:MAG: alkaline phosphatase family protein [Chitinophagaceae bacterium]